MPETIEAPVRVDEPDLEELVGTDRPWLVIVWNDPVNLMTYVVYVFQKLFGYSREKATKLMLEVHHDGKSVVSHGTREKAEMDVARLHAHGLWATMEQTALDLLARWVWSISLARPRRLDSGITPFAQTSLAEGRKRTRSAERRPVRPPRWCVVRLAGRFVGARTREFVRGRDRVRERSRESRERSSEKGQWGRVAIASISTSWWS